MEKCCLRKRAIPPISPVPKRLGAAIHQALDPFTQALGLAPQYAAGQMPPLRIPLARLSYIASGPRAAKSSLDSSGSGARALVEGQGTSCFGPGTLAWSPGGA